MLRFRSKSTYFDLETDLVLVAFPYWFSDVRKMRFPAGDNVIPAVRNEGNQIIKLGINNQPMRCVNTGMKIEFGC